MKFIKTELAKQLENEVVNQKPGATGSHTKKYPGLDFTPRQGTKGSSGFDLSACIAQDITIYPDEVVKIPTGIKLWNGSDEVVENLAKFANYKYLLAGFLLPRSSTKGAILNNTVGLCDQDYQNEIFVKLRNITNEPITVTVGEKFVQLVFMLTYVPRELEVVSEFTETTERTGGFGSTDTPIKDDLLGR